MGILGENIWLKLSTTRSDGLCFLFPIFVLKANFSGKKIPAMNSAKRKSIVSSSCGSTIDGFGRVASGCEFTAQLMMNKNQFILP